MYVIQHTCICATDYCLHYVSRAFKETPSRFVAGKALTKYTTS